METARNFAADNHLTCDPRGNKSALKSVVINRRHSERERDDACRRMARTSGGEERSDFAERGIRVIVAFRFFQPDDATIMGNREGEEEDLKSNSRGLLSVA